MTNEQLQFPPVDVMRACLVEQQRPSRARNVKRATLEDTERCCVGGPYEGETFRYLDDQHLMRSFSGDLLAVPQYERERLVYVIRPIAASKTISEYFIDRGARTPRHLHFLATYKTRRDPELVDATQIELGGEQLGPGVVDLSGMKVCEAINHFAPQFAPPQDGIIWEHVGDPEGVRQPMALATRDAAKPSNGVRDHHELDGKLGHRVYVNGLPGLLQTLHYKDHSYSDLVRVDVYFHNGNLGSFKPEQVSLKPQVEHEH